MKKFAYTTGNVDKELLALYLFTTGILSIVFFILNLYWLVFLLLVMIAIFISFIAFLIARHFYRPKTPRYWIIDEKNEKIVKHGLKNYKKEYKFHEIEEIVYSHKKGSISIKINDKPRNVYFMKILDSQVDDFEREMKACGERYRFSFRMMR